MHPFMQWCAALRRLDAVRADGKDVVLAGAGSRRFALGVHEGCPLLCWPKEDAEAMESVRWTSGALVFGMKGSDWIALSATDVRVPGAGALEPVPLRLFVPVTAGRLAAWQERRPDSIAVGSMEPGKGSGGAPAFSGKPYKVLPVKLIGRTALT